MKNDFKNEDKQRAWLDHPYCAKCGSNQGCALHHIDGRITNSILSSIMLCFKCHKEADGHNVSDEDFKIDLMRLSLPIILKSDYILVDRDYIYLQTVENRLDIINDML